MRSWLETIYNKSYDLLESMLQLIWFPGDWPYVFDCHFSLGIPAAPGSPCLFALLHSSPSWRIGARPEQLTRDDLPIMGIESSF